LAQSEAALELGQTQLALQLATQAQQRFAASNQKDSEWRAWLIASRASARSGDEPGSQSQLAHAHECFQQLEQQWGPEVFKQYLTRPDVQFYRKQLG
jgi:hypothetical protein